MSRVHPALLLLCLPGLACEAELDLPPIIEESENLILRGDEEVCEGTFDELEARVIAARELFDAPAATVEYHWLAARFFEADCAREAKACTRGHEIFAEDLGVEHELIHAAPSYSLPRPLEEGLATFLGGNRSTLSTRDEFRLALETDGSFSYQRASEFVQFLVELGGFNKLDELARRTGSEMPYSEWRPIFEEVYEQTWDDVWESYVASEECDVATMHDDVFLCYGKNTMSPVNLTPQYPQAAEYMHEMTCDDSSVVGPVGGDGLRYEVLVELDELSISTFVVALEGDVVEGSRATLTPCGVCGREATVERPGVVLTKSNWYGFLDVVPGRYVLELSQPLDAPGVLGVSLSY